MVPALLRLLTLAVAVLSWAPKFADAFAAIATPQSSRMESQRGCSSPRNGYEKSWRLFLSEGDGAAYVNEFSRTISVSKWFVGGGGGSKRGNKRMDLSVSATPEECSALAARFRLTNIASLSADVVVNPAMGLGGGAPGSDDTACVDVRGTITADVTQVCVRTNEAFDVTLEFTFDTILREMVATTSARGGGGRRDSEPLSEGELAALEIASKLGSDGGRPKRKKGGNKRAKSVSGGQQSAIDDMGMKQLQDILMEYEVTDEIIEDENCFCNGVVDCGEVVVQMFRSKLDPYPKKPGSVS